MKKPTTPLLIAATWLALLGLGGCGDSDKATTAGTTGTDDYSTIDLDQPYGGLSASDEQPAFGDPYLVSLDGRDGQELYSDELRNDADVRGYEQMGSQPGDPNDPARPRFTFVRIVWGNLDAEPVLDGRIEDGDAIDWSGQLHVDRGIVIVRRVLLFERPDDRLVHPRPNRRTVAWRSHTGSHVDGLIVQIIEPPMSDSLNSDGAADSTGPPPPNVLHFATGPFSRDFVMSEISGLDEIYPVEPEGNGVSVAGFTLGDPDVCPRGFLDGHWRENPDSLEAGGTFRGRWIDIFGLMRGYMMGAYGYDESGQPVMAGKYIRRNGQFEGLLTGTWAQGMEPGQGTFEGEWVDAEERIAGHFGGSFLQHPDRPAGILYGRWAAECGLGTRAEVLP